MGIAEKYLSQIIKDNIIKDKSKNIVNNFKNSKKNDPKYDYPTVEEGLRGMKFIDAVIESSKSSNWINI